MVRFKKLADMPQGYERFIFFMIYIDIFWSDSTAGSVRELMPAIDRDGLNFHFGVMAMIKNGLYFKI